MDRRRFLGLLGAAGAAALYVPKRSYFLGPWLPSTQQTITVTEQHAGTIYPEWRDGKLVTVTEEWTPERTRWMAEQVEHGTLSRTAVLELLGADHPDWRVLSGYDIQSLADQVMIHRPAQRDYVSFMVEDLTDLSDARLREVYTDRVIYSFARRDKLSLDLARAGLNAKQRERVIRRLARKPGPVAHAITHGERVRFWTPEAA